jgi:pyruvate,water dikinase
MAGTDRNSRLLSLSARVADDSGLMSSLEVFASGSPDPVAEAFIKEALSVLGTDSSLIFPGMGQEQNVAIFLIELSRKPAPPAEGSAEALFSACDFLNSFREEEQVFARELLDLAMASYRLRDEDNIYLGRVERLREEALTEGLSRLKDRLGGATGDYPAGEISRALVEPDYAPVPLPDEKKWVEPETFFRSRPGQLTGQPAGRGLARGIARVIEKKEDLFSFRSGEILVCDAIDPNMTFVVPLASGIVERRGGMLVHGAIIAREYGLACVTGVPEVTSLIKTGDEITVDGYLGIVVVHGKG